MGKQDRAESGPMRFGVDWTGVFIRGDEAFGYLVYLEQILPQVGDQVSKNAVEGLISLLRSCDERLQPKPNLQFLKPFPACDMTDAD